VIPYCDVFVAKQMHVSSTRKCISKGNCSNFEKLYENERVLLGIIKIAN